jgi:Flp pilus assembly protein protease CpaA
MATQEQIHLMRTLDQQLEKAEESFYQHHKTYQSLKRWHSGLGIRKGLNIFLEFIFYGWTFFGGILWVILLFFTFALLQLSEAERQEVGDDKLYEALKCLTGEQAGEDFLLMLVFFMFFSLAGSLFTAILLTRYRRKRATAQRVKDLMESLATNARTNFMQVRATRQALVNSFSRNDPPEFRTPPKN